MHAHAVDVVGELAHVHCQRDASLCTWGHSIELDAADGAALREYFSFHSAVEVFESAANDQRKSLTGSNAPKAESFGSDLGEFEAGFQLFHAHVERHR